MTRTITTRRAALAGLFTAALLASAAPLPAAADTDATWTPAASERLIKLPGNYLKKAIDNDFAKSGLAVALNDNRNLIGLKTQTLKDLQSAIEQADGDLRTELRHQFLAEKRAYLELTARQHDLRRRQAKTKIRVYERLLQKMGRRQAGMTPQKVALIAKQDEARQRFEGSLASVDTKLFRSTMTAESRYAREYAKNVTAIEALTRAIQEHPMNAQTEIDGMAVTKEDYLRQLIGENEAELALVQQEETVLGFMAKLVSLDALALSDDLAGGDADDDVARDGQDNPTAVTSAVDLFVTR
ncbi:MAG: hypothetical protein H6907_03250 [Hyphomicrobiales bacterium]|nr:hypothetical protein [Hyphomicrobiales bacterium]MCP5370724.1 hypothetical protein [Hyphomicrobiales bacterium]